MKTLPVICLLALFLFTGCEPDDPAVPESGTIWFSGVSLTDENGISLGPADSTDWQLDDVWTPTEQQLFSGQTAVVCLSGSGESIGPAFPNPASDQFRLELKNFGEAWLSMRLVDEQLEPRGQWDSLQLGTTGTHNLAIDLSNIDIRDTVRLYYLIEKALCVYRGHGDIIVR